LLERRKKLNFSKPSSVVRLLDNSMQSRLRLMKHTKLKRYRSKPIQSPLTKRRSISRN